MNISSSGRQLMCFVILISWFFPFNFYATIKITSFTQVFAKHWKSSINFWFEKYLRIQKYLYRDKSEGAGSYAGKGYPSSQEVEVFSSFECQPAN